ncbi:hypothetical protein GmHk_03G006343 [Glycine max]|nr:hypothetical protein GmHk_03G006343 [Glycine max]
MPLPPRVLSGFFPFLLFPFPFFSHSHSVHSFSPGFFFSISSSLLFPFSLRSLFLSFGLAFSTFGLELRFCSSFSRPGTAILLFLFQVLNCAFALLF